jgi:hypothetical protein
MEFLKVGAVAALALGATWAAAAATETFFGVPRPPLLLQATEGADAKPAPELSREDMEAELKRAQTELGARPSEEELREFRPTKPLAADLAIALPSDI